MNRVESSKVFPVDRKSLWNAYTNHENWKAWTIVTQSFLEQEGADNRNGVGAIRQLGPGWVFNAREEITFFDEDTGRLEYKVIGGPLPFKDHHGVVLFKEVNGGTRIDWYCTFESKVVGTTWAMKRVTQFVYDSSLRGLYNYLCC